MKGDNTTHYLDNTAAYSNNQASNPKKLKIVFEQNDFTSNKSEQAGRGLQDSLPSIVSGEPFSFAIYILDENSEVYTIDSTSIAVLRPA